MSSSNEVLEIVEPDRNDVAVVEKLAAAKMAN